MNRLFVPSALRVLLLLPATVVATVVAIAAPAASPRVYLEEMTWTEIRDAIKAGKTTAIVPTGGTEQSGPHLVVGKESYVVTYCAGLIAERLGNALVAPTMAYVPEGAIGQPNGTMSFPGSLTLPEDLFVQVLVWTGRSLAANGFTDVVLLGNNSGNQTGLKRAAEQLNAEWAGKPTRAHFVNEYHDQSSGAAPPFNDWLVKQGERAADIGSHAGIRDSSLLMAVESARYPRGTLIRWDKLAPEGGFPGSGVKGNPTRASVAYGNHGIEMKVEASVRQITMLTGRK